MTDWNICESDDEWNVYNPPVNTKPTEPYISNRFIPLFKEIKEKKILPLICTCPRKGSIKESVENTQLQNSVLATQHSIEEKNKMTKENLETNKSFEAFDFDNDETNEKPSSKRKTQASAKREKKVASMHNVMNDLLRSKLRDELEANQIEEAPKES